MKSVNNKQSSHEYTIFSMSLIYEGYICKGCPNWKIGVSDECGLLSAGLQGEYGKLILDE